MKILVTGGAGFIASHIVDKYLELGHQVLVVDNLFSGFENNINSQATFHNIDIVGEEFRQLILDEKPDIINHHAAQSSVSVSVKQPDLDARVNILGTLNLIFAAKDAGVKKIIYANTGGALFGEPEILPVKETSPIKPESPYAVSKYTAERYLYAYSRLDGIKFTSLRYSNVYGPRQNPHGEAGVVAIFANLLLDGNNCTIFGNGSKTRDYIYIDDVVRANVKAIDNADNECLLIGTGESKKDIEVYEAIRDALGFDKDPVFGSFRKGDIVHMQFDPSLAADKLDWKAETNFNDGIKKTADWFIKNKK